MDPLFPVLPEDLGKLSDEQLADLLTEHKLAAQLIKAEDEEFTKGLDGDQLLEQLSAGVDQISKIVDEQKRRKAEEEEYLQKRNDELARAEAILEVEAEAEEGEEEAEAADESESAEEGEAAEGEEASEEEAGEEASEEEALTAEVSEEPEGESKIEPMKAPLAAGAGTTANREVRPLRRPPAPSAERRAPEVGAALVAAAGTPSIRGGQVLDRLGLAESIKKLAVSIGAPTKHEGGIEQRFLVANAEFKFPEERILHPGNADENAAKIRSVVPSGTPGGLGALVASGGLCAPLENVYSMVNFATQARPVRDSLPSFQATRGGVNVPTSTIIGDIETSEHNAPATAAVGIIEEATDALGGTFSTKSCMDMDCPAYTETAVTIIYHCREYGNLNARAWPEKIAHENDLTMAAHARSAESYLLRRIRAQSLQVTQGAVGTTMNAFASLAYTINRVVAHMRFTLRMDPDARFRVLMPSWIGELLAADRAFYQFKPAEAAAALTAELAQYGITLTYFIDDVGGGTFSQGFAAEVNASTVDDFPDQVQYAVFPEGAFVHLDGGSLELGLVRDSTLNSTNDFQVFGETFENVFRLAPLQATRWVQQIICPNGVFPALGTALAC